MGRGGLGRGGVGGWGLGGGGVKPINENTITYLRRQDGKYCQKSKAAKQKPVAFASTASGNDSDEQLGWHGCVCVCVKSAEHSLGEMLCSVSRRNLIWFWEKGVGGGLPL